MLENLSTKRELHLHGRYGLATYLRASASFGSRRHSRAPSRPQAPQAARDGGWLEPVERASLWRSTLSEPYRRNQRLKNSLQTRFQPRHPQGAAVRARRHPASIAISVPLRSGQRVSPAALGHHVLDSPQSNGTVRCEAAPPPRRRTRAGESSPSPRLESPPNRPVIKYDCTGKWPRARVLHVLLTL